MENLNNYKILDLYPHNIEACKKIKKAYDEGANIVSIIRATGTGKTFIGENLVLENKNKKIVWLIPTNAIKEHIEETINNNENLSMELNFPNLEIRTYSSLINLTEEQIAEIPCDLLIVDEFHHLGAPVWGERVKTFIETHKNMKIFGMTAYNIRDRGTAYERDMTNPNTDEIFSNTVESVYDIYDAIIDGILPKPIAKSVITEDSKIIIEIKEKIQILKNKGDKTYLEYQKLLDDIIKIIHKQDGVKELIQQSIKPGGKYIYFCPILYEEGKNDIDSIMDSIKIYLEEKFPNQNIVFYKSTSADGEYGKHNRDCFYNNIDLEGNDVSDAIKIIFVKNQYNEGVHAPNVDGVFLGRKTKSDIIAFEQIGRALSVRGNTNKEREIYNSYSLEKLKQIAISRKIHIPESITKEELIEKLISPIIIDLADNIGFIEELENNLKERVQEIKEIKKYQNRTIKITDLSIEVDIINKDLFLILQEIRNKLYTKTWDDWYGLVKAYYDNHGHTEIPNRFKTKNGYDYDEEGVYLGDWCKNQRNRKHTLSEEKIKKLELLGFRFEKKIKDMPWNDWYNLVKAYYNKYGNSEIPQRFKTINGYDYDESGVNLGLWCRNLRTFKENLSKEQIKKLEQIEFRLEHNYNEREWDDWYNLAKSYFNKHGNSEIPHRFKTKNGYDYDESGEKLGIWCANQRTNKDNLDQERRKKLEQIDFRFERKTIDMTWEDWYNLAKAYYDKYGNSEISHQFKTKNGYDYDETGAKLGIWCTNQRRNEKKLSNNQIKKLTQIKFRFEKKKNNMTWDDWYNLAKVYYQKHKHSEVPRNFKTHNGQDYDKQGLNLGTWCDRQRQKKDKLSEEQHQKLLLIEFRFNTKEETEQKKIQLCFKYGIEYTKYSILKRISYLELYSKISFLLDHNYPVIENDNIHEIFYMSNENMTIKYIITKEEMIEQYYIDKRGKKI